MRPDRQQPLERARSSVLRQLASDEVPVSRLKSEDWLKKWCGIGASGESLAMAGALATALPTICQFRRVLRNFVEGLPLEDRVDSAESGTTQSYASIREGIMRCYLFLLCRQAARHAHWTAACARFLEDEIVLFAVPEEEMPASDPMACKEGLIEIVTSVHTAITTGHSLHRVKAPWPVVPELALGFLASSLRNFKGRMFREYEDTVQEHLFPALSALSGFATSSQATQLLQFHWKAATGRNEFHALAQCNTRLSDNRRPVFLRLYAMTIERILWLADDAASAGKAGAAGGESRALSDIAAKMDLAIDSGKMPRDLQVPRPLATWAESELRELATQPAPTGPRGRKLFARMIGPPHQTQGRLAAEVLVNSDSDTALRLVVHLADYQLPETVEWFEVEFAARATDDNSRSALFRLPADCHDGQRVEKDAKSWVSYEIAIDQLDISPAWRAPAKPTIDAAFRTTADGRGAFVLVVLTRAVPA